MRLLRGVRDRYEARAMGHPTPWLLLYRCMCTVHRYEINPRSQRKHWHQSPSATSSE